MVSGWGFDSATSPVLSARSQCTNQNAPLLWPLHETRPSFHYPAENSICVSRSIFYPFNARTGLKILSLNPCVGGRFLFSLGCVGFAPPPPSTRRVLALLVWIAPSCCWGCPQINFHFFTVGCLRDQSWEGSWLFLCVDFIEPQLLICELSSRYKTWYSDLIVMHFLSLDNI